MPPKNAMYEKIDKMNVEPITIQSITENIANGPKKISERTSNTIATSAKYIKIPTKYGIN